jgi:hypothetical protein
MITEILSQGSGQLPDDELQPSAILPYKPKARFHWPPDCLNHSCSTDQRALI